MSHPVPAGSCFILVPNALIARTTRNGGELIDSIIASNRVHMMKVNTAMLRQQLKDGLVLLMTEGHKVLVSKIPKKSLEKLVSQDPLSSTSSSLHSSHSDNMHTSAPESIHIPDLPESTLPVDKSKSVEKKKSKVTSTISSTKGTNQQKKSMPKGTDVGEQLLIDLTQDDDSVKGTPVESVPEDLDDKFIPVTKETLRRATSLIRRFEQEKRAVAIVFDSCFYLENLDYREIRKKFAPIFGSIHRDHVLIRVKLPHLMDNVDQAIQRGIERTNQAYIIGQKGLSEEEINKRASARSVFCCPMTIGCIIKNLGTGIFLMQQSVLTSPSPKLTSPAEPHNTNPQFNAQQQLQVSEHSTTNRGAPEQVLNTCQVSDTQLIENLTNMIIEAGYQNNDPISVSPKPNRIAATLQGYGELKSPPPGLNALAKSYSGVAGLRPNYVLLSTTANNVNGQLPDIDQIVKELANYGESVIEVDGLPPQLTVQTLNLMMGTFTLKSEQMIGANIMFSGRKVLHLWIALPSTNEDIKQILNKDKCKTCIDSILRIRHTDWLSLRNFLIQNRNRLTRLSSEGTMPINCIGYASKSLNASDRMSRVH